MCLGLMMGYAASADAVDFSLNFTPNASPWQEGITTGFCAFGSSQCNGFDLGNGDPTPFQETVENIGGTYYFHVIVGDPASGFASESYTPWAGGPNIGTDQGTIPSGGGAFSPTSGGNETAYIGNPDSTNPPSIGGTGSTGVATFLQGHSNMSNPLAGGTTGSHISGNGTGDPTQVVFRMVMTDAKGDMSLEVSKPFLNKKPIISQTVQDGAMSSSFVADMSAISYSDMNTPATVVNNLTITDPNLGSAADFEMALSQHSDVTAGRYTYTPGAGWNNPNGWDATNSSFTPGTYTYFDTTGFNPLAFDWTTDFHYNENRLACERPSSTSALNNGIRSQMQGGASCPNAN